MPSETVMVWSKLLPALLLAGCSGQPLQGEPLAAVSIIPIWSTPAQIREACGPEKGGCSDVGHSNWQVIQMWLEKPLYWDDAHMAILGHEVAHALGWRHDGR